MERKIIETSDGSRSLYMPELDETYHSRHGAVQEAYHVFIRSGLDLFKKDTQVRILEMGFGTGLNCLITLLEANRRNLKISYCGLEAYPVEVDVARELNYPEAVGQKETEPIFEELHNSAWGEPVKIDKGFELKKVKGKFSDFKETHSFDLIYFDAFGPRVQPDLWTEAMFRKMYVALDEKGVLVTYSAKGSVRRAMLEVGFEVERLPGPPGKREMLRASKGSWTF
jgi:tRNA U34 5-methylaminomethyl-2-thiouridine-forming methyltransferase MnmC